jgi:preprotein translocase subunit YajC
MIFNFATVLAMAAPPGSEGGIGSMVPTFTMFAAIIGIFYFMIIRPQQKRMKEHQSLLSAIKRGDKVLLTGGMHGTIYEVEEKTLMVEIAKNTVVRFEKGSVQSVVTAA